MKLPVAKYASMVPKLLAGFTVMLLLVHWCGFIYDSAKVIYYTQFDNLLTVVLINLVIQYIVRQFDTNMTPCYRSTQQNKKTDVATIYSLGC